MPFAGYSVSDAGVRPDPNRVQSLRNVPVPRDQTGVKSFMGLLFIVYCYRRASAKAEGDDTKENKFSQGPLGKPPRHYTMLAQSTRGRYTRNIWPEPLMGYLWG